VRQSRSTFRKKISISNLFLLRIQNSICSLYRSAAQATAGKRGTMTPEMSVLYDLTNLQNVSLSAAASSSGRHSGQQETLSKCVLDEVQSQLNIFMSCRH
jgi:hypothetical protein